MYHMRVTDKDDGMVFEATGKRDIVMDCLIFLFPKIRKIGGDANRWAYATPDHNVLITRDKEDPEYKEES